MSAAEQSEAGPSSAPQGEAAGGKKPVVIMCIGMAGSVSHLQFSRPRRMLIRKGQDDTDAASELAPTFEWLASLYP